jgi:hypothetical protein
MIRRWLCKWFAMHDMDEKHETLSGCWDLVRCKNCGLDAAIHWHTREIRLMSRGR